MSRIQRSIAIVLLAAVLPTAGALAWASQRGNRIQISLPARVTHGTVYDVTLHGFAAHRAAAHLFLDYAGCDRTEAAERQRAFRESQAYRVKGAFDVISGWRSSAQGVDHACAYLVSRSGRLLARAHVRFRIH